MIFLLKTFRAILENRKTYIACALLIAVGIFTYVAMGISAYALEDSMNIYYDNYNMGDAFATINSAPQSVDYELRGIEGIDAVSARLSYDARAEIENSPKVITLRLISFEEEDEALNKFHIAQGFPPEGENSIVVGEDFFNAHGLETGQQIKLIIEGREYNFNISATALSPEFVYAMKDETTLFPDHSTFGFAYIDYNSLATIINMSGMANDICITFKDGYVFDDVKYELEDELNKYGLSKLIARKDHLSHSMLEQEIISIKSMASSISLVFVAASMVILYLMLKRLIEQDRAQIGTLKAFGYSGGQILFHYLTYGVITGIAGGVAGAAAGVLSSGGLLNMYSEFFRMPEIASYKSGAFIARGIAIAVAGGILGSFMGAYSVIRLSPAEAMRPKPPKIVKKDILTAFPFIKTFLTSRGNMAVRSIGRSKVRSMFIILGMTFSFGIMAVMNSLNTMMDAFVSDRFTKSQVYSAKMTFKTPLPYDEALESVYNIEGVDLAETLLEMPVALKNHNIEEGAIITGINENSSLYKIYDGEKKTYFSPDSRGLVISAAMAKKLNVSKGDEIYISSPLVNDDIPIYIYDIVNESIGANCYLPDKNLGEILGIGRMATSVIFNSEDIPSIQEQLKEGKNLLTIDDVADMQKAVNDMMGSYDGMLFTMRFIGIFVALAIIYNTSGISLSERKREYATLRVLGLESKEVSEIMAFEYWLLSAAGMALGIPFTRFLKESISAMMDVELFTIPLYTDSSAFVLAAAGC
ncbi:FtsX-like permease family protein, partial [Tyzzerella sp. OttesenSCG-928-J15]|nr:FtsX-like permease family protein [Tyzzerella sp. OttesenSCG-928-J15]